MNVTTYLKLLSQQLCDIDGNALTTDVLTQYMAQAVTEYSRWRGLKRTSGVGGLAITAQPASTTLTVVGGPYKNGSTIILDAYTPFAETVTINTVTQIDPSLEPLYVGTPVQLNLTGATASVHYAGGLVANVVTGLSVIVGQSQYPMPLDFLSPENDSWNIATGQRAYLKQYQTYYDSIYEYSTLQQGIDLGQAQNFIGGSFAGFPGVPSQANGSLAPLPTFGASQGYVFTGSGQVILNILPTPQSPGVLNFNYWALQQPETVPPSDMDALLAYGVYLGVANNAVLRSVYPDLRDVRQDEKFSAAAANCRELAQNYLNKFDTAIRLRPLAISG